MQTVRPQDEESEIIVSDKKSRYCPECGQYIPKPPGPYRPPPRWLELSNCVVFLVMSIFFLGVCSTIWWKTHWWMTPIIAGCIVWILVYTRRVYKSKDRKDEDG